MLAVISAFEKQNVWIFCENITFILQIDEFVLPQFVLLYRDEEVTQFAKCFHLTRAW